MDTYSTIVSFFQDGGIFMYPIAIVFAVGLAVAGALRVPVQDGSRQPASLEESHAVHPGRQFSEAAGLAARSKVAIGSI